MRHIKILVFFLSVLSLLNVVFGQFTSETPEPVDQAQTAISNGADFSGSLPTDSQISFPNGQSAIISGNVEVRAGKIVSADSLEYQNRNFRNVQNFDTTPDGFTADFVQELTFENTLVSNGKGIVFSNGRLSVEEADVFRQGNSVTTQARNADISQQDFSVEEADSVISGPLIVNSIENTEFTIGSDQMIMKTKKGTTLEIIGNNFNAVSFEAFSDESIIIASKIKDEYEIKDGKLNFSTDDFTDTLETNSTAKVEMDELGFGFKCLLLNPTSTYWYNNKADFAKDFGVIIPKNGELFRLCIRKDPVQNIGSYDGLINIPDNFIVLNKIVNYLKYPFKNNEPSSLLMNNLFSDLSDFNVNLELDENFNFINRVLIRNNNGNSNIGTSSDEKTITKPSNYYEIKEKSINNETHRLLKINFRLNNNELTQSRIFSYQTGYFSPIANIDNNILTQEDGKNKITVLAPRHKKINGILN